MPQVSWVVAPAEQVRDQASHRLGVGTFCLLGEDDLATTGEQDARLSHGVRIRSAELMRAIYRFDQDRGRFTPRDRDPEIEDTRK